MTRMRCPADGLLPRSAIESPCIRPRRLRHVVLKPDLESVALRNKLHAIGNRHAEPHLTNDDEIVQSEPFVPSVTRQLRRLPAVPSTIRSNSMRARTLIGLTRAADLNAARRGEQATLCRGEIRYVL